MKKLFLFLVNQPYGLVDLKIENLNFWVTKKAKFWKFLKFSKIFKIWTLPKFWQGARAYARTPLG